MISETLFANLLAWSLQVGLLTALAALLVPSLRIELPSIRYAWWRCVLLICLTLPAIQPWKLADAPSISDVFGPSEVPPPPGVEAVSVRSSATRPVPMPSIPWGDVFAIVLVAGAAVRLIWLGAGVLRLRRLRKAGEPAAPCDGHDELARLVEAGAEIRYVPSLGQPLTFGLHRPVVLLPSSLRKLPDHVQRAVLAHELWHVRRRDWAWILAEESVRAILWFHPAIWFLVSRVQSAREEVVDELTVLLTNSRRGYLEALLAFADEPPFFAAAPFARRRHLFQRMLLISREVVMSSRRIVISSAVMLAVVTATAWTGASLFPLTAAARTQELAAFRDNTVVTMRFRAASLKDVLNHLGELWGVKVTYAPDFREYSLTVSLQNVTFARALTSVLGPTGNTYEIVSADTLLIRSRPAGFAPQSTQAPPRDLRPGQPGPAASREGELEKAIAAAPQASVVLYYELARLQESRGAIEEAEATLQKGRQAFPGHTGIVNQLLGLYQRQNQFDRAVAVVEDLAAADPSNPAAHLRVAQLYQEKVQKDLALSATEKQTYIDAGLSALDRGLTYNADHVESLMSKSLLLRMKAALETDRVRSAQIVADADLLRNRAAELRKTRSREIVEQSATASNQLMSVDGQAPVRVGGNVRPPTKLKDVRPEYPPDAQEAKVQGVVILEAVIDASGRVRNARVLRSVPMLDAAAIEAVRQWEFTPTLLNGAGVPVIMAVTVNFVLQ